jgi:hypothetical protein
LIEGYNEWAASKSVDVRIYPKRGSDTVEA